MLRLVLIPALLYLLLVAVVFLRQRRMLYFPSHELPATTLRAWTHGGRLIGYAREKERPRAIWLMTHGNGGQAANRDYVLQCLSPEDSLYVLEYPGYGQRPGKPSRSSFNMAAIEAYHLLRAEHPGTPLCVLGESIGSGPASMLASELPPPDKLVLVVPFDRLADVATETFPWLPVRFLLLDRWDNVEVLRAYQGRIEIFAARDDRVIPMSHAKALATQIPRGRLVIIPGGHNDWSAQSEVRLEP